MSGLSLLHPVTLIYALSFASLFAWPLAASGGPGEPCRDLTSDWIVVIGSAFTSAFIHSFYCLWLLERVLHFSRESAKDGDPPLGMGEGIAAGGTFGTWSAYFGFRLALSAVATLIAVSIEISCAPLYHQLLAILLVVDSAFTILAFAASWSMERIASDEARMTKAAKKTHGEEKKD